MYSFLSVVAIILSIISSSAVMASDQVIRVGGSGTGTGVMRHLAEAFEKRNPGIRIAIAPSLGSSGGIKALIGGSLDIALSARALKDDEKSSGAVSVFSGRTPFVFMVNRGVAINAVAAKDLEAFYGMKRTTWEDGSPVRLILRPEGDSDTKLIQAISPELSNIMKTTLSRPGMFVAMTDQDSDKAIVRTPGSLGATTLAQFLSDRLEGKMLVYGGVKPSLKAMKSGLYPLVKPQMVLAIPAKLTPAQKKFVTFLSSSQAGAIWEKYGIQPDGK